MNQAITMHSKQSYLENLYDDWQRYNGKLVEAFAYINGKMDKLASVKEQLALEGVLVERMAHPIIEDITHFKNKILA